MKRCQWIVNDDGTQSRLDERGIERLRSIQNEWCMLGQRVLLICKKVESVSAGSGPMSASMPRIARFITARRLVVWFIS